MTTFAGDKKVGTSILHHPEHTFITYWTPKIPAWIETYHLTYSTIVWSILIILFGFLSQWNIHWLWGMSVCIFLQWLTDSLDGSVGRFRNTGLIKWGYYMDHFLDYIFLASILIGHSFIIPDDMRFLQFFILGLFGAFMINSYLSFAATNEFRITYLGIGPTEIRLIFILANTLIIFLGKTYMRWALPFIMIGALVGLIFVVYRTQKYIWKIDMDYKKQQHT